MKTPLTPSIHKTIKADSDGLDRFAADALTYLAEDGERISLFFATTGLGPGDLRGAAARSGFAANLLDYLSGDETRLMQFAAARDYDPAALARLRQRLSPTYDDP